jgi:hypothetical protein
MDPNETSKETSSDMMKLAAGLNEMRDALVVLSTLIKDYKATMDWDRCGAGKLTGMSETGQIRDLVSSPGVQRLRNLIGLPQSRHRKSAFHTADVGGRLQGALMQSSA